MEARTPVPAYEIALYLTLNPAHFKEVVNVIFGICKFVVLALTARFSDARAIILTQYPRPQTLTHKPLQTEHLYSPVQRALIETPMESCWSPSTVAGGNGGAYADDQQRGPFMQFRAWHRKAAHFFLQVEG